MKALPDLGSEPGRKGVERIICRIKQEILPQSSLRREAHTQGFRRELRHRQILSSISPQRCLHNIISNDLS